MYNNNCFYRNKSIGTLKNLALFLRDFHMSVIVNDIHLPLFSHLFSKENITKYKMSCRIQETTVAERKIINLFKQKYSYSAVGNIIGRRFAIRRVINRFSREKR